MAAQWRVEVESIEGMQAKPLFPEEIDVPGEAPGTGAVPATVLRNVVFEITSGRCAAQRTKPVDVPNGGRMQLSKTLFVAPPAHGSGLVIRAIRLSGAASDALLGEAEMAQVMPGRRRVELTRGGAFAGTLVLNVMQGTPSNLPLFDPATVAKQRIPGTPPVAAPPEFASRNQKGVPVPAEAEEDRTLPPGWRSRYDSSSGAFYYFRVDPQGVPNPGSVRWTKPAPASAELMAATQELRAGKITERSAELAASPSSRPAQSPSLNKDASSKSSPTPSVVSHSSDSTAVGRLPLHRVIGSAPACQSRPQQQQQQQQQQQHVRSSPPTNSTPQGPPAQRNDPSSSAVFAAKAAAAIAREARIDQEFREARPLRQRSSMMPVIGTCDATIEALESFTPPLKNPRFVIGLEGQEFRVDRRDLKAGPSNFTLPFASLGSNLQLLCYDCPGEGVDPYLVGRILVPLTDAVHPTGHPMRLSSILADRCRDEAPVLKREYRLQFLPGPPFDPQNGDPYFTDRFTTMHLVASLQAASAAEGSCSRSSLKGSSGSFRAHAWTNGHGRGAAKASADGMGALGSVALSIELTLQPEVAKPVSLYWASIASGIQQAVRSDAPPACAPWAPLCQKGPGGGLAYSTAADGMSAVDAAHWFQAEGVAGLESIFQSLSRLVHFWISPSQGWSRWLRSSWWHAPAAALAWLFFCVGYFPPPLWTWPLYAWLYLLADGLLAAGHRRCDWRAGGERALEQLDIEEGSLQRDLRKLGFDCRIGRPSCRVKFAREDEEEEDEDDEDSDTGMGVGPLDSDTSSDVHVHAGHRVQPDFATEESPLHALVRHVHRFEPLLANLAGFAERLSNLASFADGTASAIGYIALGAVALCISFVLVLVTWVDPSLGFAVGLDGAISILYFSRMPLEKPVEPFSMQRKFNQIMACVPDEAELVHRLVATEVQRRKG